MCDNIPLLSPVISTGYIPGRATMIMERTGDKMFRLLRSVQVICRIIDEEATFISWSVIYFTITLLLRQIVKWNVVSQWTYLTRFCLFHLLSINVIPLSDLPVDNKVHLRPFTYSAKQCVNWKSACEWYLLTFFYRSPIISNLGLSV